MSPIKERAVRWAALTIAPESRKSQYTATEIAEAQETAAAALSGRDRFNLIGLFMAAGGESVIAKNLSEAA